MTAFRGVLADSRHSPTTISTSVLGFSAAVARALLPPLRLAGLGSEEGAAEGVASSSSSPSESTETGLAAVLPAVPPEFDRAEGVAPLVRSRLRGHEVLL